MPFVIETQRKGQVTDKRVLKPGDIVLINKEPLKDPHYPESGAFSEQQAEVVSDELIKLSLIYHRFPLGILHQSSIRDDKTILGNVFPDTPLNGSLWSLARGESKILKYANPRTSNPTSIK